MSTLNSSKPGTIMTNSGTGIMFYDELEQASEHQAMKVLGAELQEQIETCPSEVLAEELPGESQASSKYVNPLKSTDGRLEEEWDSYFDKGEKKAALDQLQMPSFREYTEENECEETLSVIYEDEPQIQTGTGTFTLPQRFA